MKRVILVGLMILVISLLTLSCGKKYTRYVPTSDVPRMIYMTDDVLRVQTVSGRLHDKQVYVEVTTRDGKKESGKLMRIDEEDLVMSLGYYYSTDGETTEKVDVERMIPKEEIILLKVF